MAKTFYKRILNPFNYATWEKGRKHPVFFVITIEQLDGNDKPDISVCGDYINGCGQCIDNFTDVDVSYNKGWDKNLYLELIDFWHKYHLKFTDEGSDLFNEAVELANKFPKAENVRHHIYFKGY